ncbi:MAG TPA: TIM barrel protein [Saprospiraceae bacterium]|nr:TIM barrel protein [Saprospiraceae bacterium]HMQ83568.1 TIM barrel protein [Saprospiraceae bacterium]
MNRRAAMKNAALTIGTLAIGQSVQATQEAEQQLGLSATNHSACRWCYGDIPLEELADRGKDIGLKSIELLKHEEWAVVQSRGLTCAMGQPDNLSLIDGFNDPKNHANLQADYQTLIKRAADAGIPSVICMSGNRRGMSDYQGMINCAIGLRPLVKQAEEAGVLIQMELLNSKVDHGDYMCDHTAWGAGLAEMINSPNFKLLYDIYHMQIMEGDVIATIRKYHNYIGHYHTGGVPGRHEINASQELNYSAIIKAIHETGFKGYVAQEFIPTYKDKLAALAEGLKICG